MHNIYKAHDMTKKLQTERGFVSILTVMFFIILISVISVGFTRIMIQEQRQTLEDELTKSAYNSALSGVEDAKRAMLYCASLSGVDKTNCETQLYKSECPGFNDSTHNFIGPSGAGVLLSSSGKTPLVGNDSATSPQGYSCVIVSKESPDVQAHLVRSRSSGAMYEMKTTAPYNEAIVSWHKTSSTPDIPLAGKFNSGNPRDDNGFMTGVPAVLRITAITLPVSGSPPFGLNDGSVKQVTSFVYPTGVATQATMTHVDTATPLKRLETKCGNGGEYSCSVRITYENERSNNSFILVHALYSDTEISITPYNDVDAVTLDGAQPTIDSTGYAAGIFRRVKVGVSEGGLALNAPTALDTGRGLCKDFRVGLNPTHFQNLVATLCQP